MSLDPSERTIRSAVGLAASDPQIATDTFSWDIHPMLLNTEGGIVDLQTGEVRPHDPMYLMTQITFARIGSGCPRWLQFLDEITNGDMLLASYLQRLAGYCLTGSTSEQCFAFLHGHGANGKSVFVSTLSNVLGSYAATATLDTFAASRSARHLTELAGLRAARLVVVPETEAGQGWAEARIKTVTGGERIRANFMHKDHFEYLPQFKLLVAGNHRPSLSNVGEAMRRRLHLVPFATAIPAEKRDHRLTEKLWLERDGILGWMIAGCIGWQREGLSPPPIVTEAVRNYFASEDLVGQWLDECCVLEGSEPSAGLFQSWKGWAEASGFIVGTQKSLGETLRTKGFRDGKVQRARGWYGISLRREPPMGPTTP